MLYRFAAFWRRPFRLLVHCGDPAVQIWLLDVSLAHPHTHHNGSTHLQAVFVSLILCTPVQSLVDGTVHTVVHLVHVLPTGVPCVCVRDSICILLTLESIW